MSYLRDRIASAAARVEAAFAALQAASERYGQEHEIRHAYDESNPGHRLVDLSLREKAAARDELDRLRAAVTAADGEVHDALVAHYELASEAA